MSNSFEYAAFAATHLDACLALFDDNCPEFFAPNERADYEAFLASAPEGYCVCVTNGRVVAAFGVIDDGRVARRRLNWILVARDGQGRGVGRAIMAEVLRTAADGNARVIDIAASQQSAPFFARFGAREIRRQRDGWGPGMHRVDMELPLSPTPTALEGRRASP